MKRKAFTLLEVLVAIALFLIASGVIGWRMHKAIEKKKFQSELERLRVRLKVSQKMAISMQADWKGTLQWEGKGWLFDAYCEEVPGKHLTPLHLEPLEIFLDGKKVERLTLDFFANGYIFPEGKIIFQSKGGLEEWKLSEVFLREQGKKLGPLHPND